jgi:hypothetical protein
MTKATDISNMDRSIPIQTRNQCTISGPKDSRQYDLLRVCMIPVLTQFMLEYLVWRVSVLYFCSAPGETNSHLGMSAT